MTKDDAAMTAAMVAESAPAQASAGIVETAIPARLDRLPWGRFHTLVVVALGITWILDGLEVTLAGAISPALKESPRLHFSNADVGLVSSAYLAGAVLGALLFGWLTDRLGRKRLFFITLAVYLVATAATALSWSLWSFAVFRFFTGAGIGGEYTAINSTIQELVPARYRGWTDLVINGSFWVGAAVGAAGSIVLLDPLVLPPDLGWRLAFLIGAVLGLAIFFMRFWLPESPRWLMTHGRVAEADAVLAGIEGEFHARGHRFAAEPLPVIRLRARRFTPLSEVARTLFRVERRRTLVGLSLMVAQAFFYNAIFFTYALVLTDFYGIRADYIGWYLLPFAAGNFLGPVLLGRLFDTIGRRPMIAATYAISGVLLAGAGYLFAIGALSATGQTIAWMVIFFFASAAASSAYLTVSETFPLEIRALAIAFFYAIGTGIGGVAGPWLFGALIDSGSRWSVFGGYLFGAVLMLAAALIAGRWGVAAERKSLESISRPLAAAD
jgi:MFS family permease